MATTAHLLNYLLPPTSTKLGRLTTSAHRPHHNYHDPLLPRPSITETHTANHIDFRETRTFTRRSRLSVGLADLLSLRFTTTATGAATLAAPQTTTADLANSDAWFVEACAQEPTQRWMEAAAKRGDSVYLVVGIRSACNATLTAKRAGGHTAGVFSVVPSVAVAPPEASLGGQWDRGGEMGMKAVGEMVYAVLYRKVRLRKVFARSAEAVALEGGCRWREVWDWTVSQRERRPGRMPLAYRRGRFSDGFVDTPGPRRPVVEQDRSTSRDVRRMPEVVVIRERQVYKRPAHVDRSRSPSPVQEETRTAPAVEGGEDSPHGQLIPVWKHVRLERSDSGTDAPTRVVYIELDEPEVSEVPHPVTVPEELSIPVKEKEKEEGEEEGEGALWEAAFDEEEWDAYSDGEDDTVWPFGDT